MSEPVPSTESTGHTPSAKLPTAARAVLDFWFGPPDDPDHTRSRAMWFRKDADFDRHIAQRFGPLIEQALAGDLDHWMADPRAALALVIVLDQFTRNALRGQARAFAGDAAALAAARAMVASGMDRGCSGVQRQFIYLPFEHAENMDAQRTSLALFARLESDEPVLAGVLDWARRHHDIVARFGRFPHRNAALGRLDTAEESAFLVLPGSSF